MPPLFNTVYEDESLLVINKAAGLVCHPTKGDAYSSLISRVRLHLGTDAKPHLVNRLDRETSGLVLVAKEQAVAAELRKLWEKRVVVKEYLAIVHGTMAATHGAIEEPLGKDDQSEVAIKDCVRSDGAPARTDYVNLGSFVQGNERYSLLRVTPHTGRKHQIRIHLSHIGHPIVGDKLYGRDEKFYLEFVRETLTAGQWQTLVLRHQALHAAHLAFEWRSTFFAFAANPEAAFIGFLDSGRWNGGSRPDVTGSLPVAIGEASH